LIHRFSRVPALPLALLLLWSACSDSTTAVLDDAADDPAPLRTASACVLVASDGVMASRIDALRAEVDVLDRAGALNSGQTTALTQHLDNALRQLERGQYCATSAQLAAFRKQLETFTDAGELSDREAFELRLQSRLATFDPASVTPGEEEQYAPGYTGELRTLRIAGSDIPVEVIDGLAIFTGDIVLGFVDELEAQTGTGGPAAVGPCTQDGLICGRWSDGVIGYDYFLDWEDRTGEMITAIQQAIREWEGKTGLRFERRASGERIIFRNGTGCSSWIGRQVLAIFDPQYIFLNKDNCRQVGTIAHEIGHSVGFWHEQSRNDRDNFIQINSDAIADGKGSNFSKFLALGVERGGYDLGSIMHYACGLFKKEGATENPIEPIVEGATCADVGQRDGLSPNDVVGAYFLYRPRFQIVGASEGETRDRFDLSLQFDVEPVPDEWIRWNVDRAGAGTGPTFSTLAAGLSPGPHTLLVQIFAEGIVLATNSITITIANTPPSVELGPNRTVDMNRSFSVAATVVDAEDGSCPISACTFEWDPTPETDRGGAADFRYTTAGTRRITATVTDGGGGVGADQVEITVVDSPPVLTVLSPTPGARFNEGATVAYSGFATDVNLGPGPEPGRFECYEIHWSSLDPTDRFNGMAGCDGFLTLGTPGTRTVTVAVTDGVNTTSTSFDIEVGACGTNCPPDVSFVLDTPSELDGSSFSPSFTGPGYDLGTDIAMTARIDDREPDNPVAYEWKLLVPGLFGSAREVILGSGSLTVPGTNYFTFNPSDARWGITRWPTCATTAIPHVLVLTATDARGAVGSARRTLHLGCQFG
jgi:astacin